VSPQPEPQPNSP
jgi:hypothetical protein